MCNFFRTMPTIHYEDALIRADDPGQFTAALKHAGYATDPHYAENSKCCLWRRFDFGPYGAKD